MALTITIKVKALINYGELHVHEAKGYDFNFNFIFIDRFVKILTASVIMGIFFNYIIYFFNNELSYQENFKAIYLIGTVIAGLIFYFFIVYWHEKE